MEFKITNETGSLLATVATLEDAEDLADDLASVHECVKVERVHIDTTLRTPSGGRFFLAEQQNPGTCPCCGALVKSMWFYSPPDGDLGHNTVVGCVPCSEEVAA